MAPIAARNFSATSLPTQITTTIDNQLTTTNIPVKSTAGFPTAPFTGCFERNTPNQEFVLVTAVASDGFHFTVVRGYDGTPPVQHLTPATFEHAVGAIDYREANQHHTDATRDDHAQYLLTAGGRASTGLQAFNSGISTPSIAGTVAFANIPTGPAADPTTANQLVRKQYADGFLRWNQTAFSGYPLLFTAADWATYTPSSTGQITVTFSPAFPGICDFVMPSIINNGTQAIIVNWGTPSKAQATFHVFNASSGAAWTTPVGISYFAVGH